VSRLLVATLNPGKLREFKEALAPHGIEVVGLEAIEERSWAARGFPCLGAPGAREPVEETGATFEENARIKAEAHSRGTGLAVLADDSGLEVDALQGEPGVRSARYGGANLDDAGRCALVLEQLRDVPSAMRRARFRCVLAIARAGKTIALFEGAVEGRILDRPRGENGFGYDPIFFHERARRTFAELTRAEKEALSHRGEAIRRLIEAVHDEKVEI
jgi:XTP/dITP diphosphohydrolase